jgi:DNA-binding MarR family transcriptional regulator
VGAHAVLETYPSSPGRDTVDAETGFSGTGLVAETGEVIAVADIAPIAELMLRFVVAFHSLNAHQPCQGPAMSPRHARTIMHLARFPRRTMGELAEGLDISLSWASRIVDDLVDAGRVERVRDPDDRRVIHVRLTAAARDIAEHMLRERGQLVADALAILSPSDRPAVLRFLRRLIPGVEALASQSAPADPGMQIVFGSPAR